MKEPKILFVVPHTTGTELGLNVPYLGLLYIASFVRSKKPKSQIKILDYNMNKFSEEDLKKNLDEFKPDFVGISTTSIQFKNAVKVAQIIKKSCNATLVMGGVHPTHRPLEAIEYCDIVVVGEGEQTFFEIVDERPLEDIKGILYKENGSVKQNAAREFIKDLNDLPTPAYDLVDLGKYNDVAGFLGIMCSRGCPYNCTFCGSPAMWKRIVRFLSPQRVVDDIEYLHKTYNCNYIKFYDDTINIPLKRALDVCNEIIRRGLHKEIKFDAMIRANSSFVSKELFEKLKEANFVKIEIGVESGSPKVLKALNKELTVEELENAIKLCKESGIDTWGFFMIGNWDETVFDIFKTWKFIFKTKINPNFAVTTPFPGTELLKTLEKNNLLPKDFDLSKGTTRLALVRTNKLSRLEISIMFWLSGLLFIFQGRSFSEALKWGFTRFVDIFKGEVIFK